MLRYFSKMSKENEKTEVQYTNGTAKIDNETTTST